MLVRISWNCEDTNEIGLSSEVMSRQVPLEWDRVLESWGSWTPLLLGCTRHDDAQTNNPAYSAPPRNSISDALHAVENSLNSADSTRYWQSFLWESREWEEPRNETQMLWDSTRGAQVRIRLLSSTTFQNARAL